MNSKLITFIKNIELGKCPSGFKKFSKKKERTWKVGLEGGLMLAGKPVQLVLKIGHHNPQFSHYPFHRHDC